MMIRYLFVLLLLCQLPQIKAQVNNTDSFDKEYVKCQIVKVSNWQLTNFKRRALNSWTSGVFYSGLFAAWEVTQSQHIYEALLKMGNTTLWQPNKLWYHADDITICQTYIDLYRIEKKEEIIKPTIDTLALLMRRPFPAKGEKEFTTWWWADALFMASPVLVKMGVTLNNNSYLEFCDKKYKECYDKLYVKKEKLFARDLTYIIKNDGNDVFEDNMKPVFWLRGNGWVIAGLAKILDELPHDYPNRKFYLKLYKEMAARIVSLQQSDGLWRSGLLDPDSYTNGEVSGSALFCYALSWGVNNNIIKGEKYNSAIQKSWIALQKCVDVNGRVGWVQGAGTAPTTKLSFENSELYGTGAYLLAAGEIYKYKMKF